MPAKSVLMALMLALAQTAVAAQAGEKEAVCAKYETQDGWSKSYQVEANVLTGADLNAATGTWKYSAYSNYVVIFWKENEASVIKMNYSFGLSFVPQEGIDQEGRHWKVSQSNGYCI